MGELTKIEWCDHTFNPWIGCTKVSDGCKNCYAETLMDKRYGKVTWGPEGVRVKTKTPWQDVRKWRVKAKQAGRRVRVFCASSGGHLPRTGPRWCPGVRN
jgi:DNA repair photolyase